MKTKFSLNDLVVFTIFKDRRFRISATKDCASHSIMHYIIPSGYDYLITQEPLNVFQQKVTIPVKEKHLVAVKQL